MDFSVLNDKKVVTVAKWTALGVAAILVLYAFYFAVWTLYNTETGNGDNVEHMHASWLIAFGKVPYRDFFQHHNPLLWYLFTPIFSTMRNAVKMLNMAHMIGVTCGFLTFAVTYKICTRFFASSLASLLALVILCPPYYYVFCFNFNPDTFMALSFAIGLYYLLEYWDTAKLPALCGSFFAFFIAFLFTQKVLMILTVLGGMSLYMFYLKKSPLSDILCALLLPLGGLLIFMLLLYNADILDIYWRSNYPFNITMQKYYGEQSFWITTYVADYEMLAISFICALLGSLCFIWRENAYYRVVAVLFLIESALRWFYFTIAPYYLLPLMILMCCLNSVLIDKLAKKQIFLVYIFLIIGVCYAAISKTRYGSVRGPNRSFAQYLADNITPCDYFISGFFGNQSILSKDPHYYWSMLGHVDMAAEEEGIVPHPDVNELVLKYKPKMVYTGVYWSSYYKNRGISVPIQQVSIDILNQFYMPTPFGDFAILKPEYWHTDCQYNAQKGEWLYVK